MKSGIYIIKNTYDGKVYIGQSVDVKRRLRTHKRLLNLGIHKNTYLQSAFNLYKEYIDFQTIELCNVDALNKREQHWIRKFDSTNRAKGYNRESGGSEGQKWCEESKEARKGEGNPMFGKHQSTEFIEWIRMHNRASSDKLTVNDVEDIKVALTKGARQVELAKEYNVTVSTVNKIASAKNWSWVLPELNADIKKNIEGERQKKKEEIAEKKAIFLKNEEERKNIIKNVRSDFEKGIPKNEIMKKYGISSTSYVRYTTDLFNKHKEKLVKLCLEKRADGMQVKDIAKELGLHRTTVTEYCKMVHVNTESAEINCICND